MMSNPYRLAWVSQVLYYALLGRPRRVSELTLRDRMGGGNFGQARQSCGVNATCLTAGMEHAAF